MYAHYSIGITQTLAKELGEYNINVNAVCPGTLRTQMWEAILDGRATRQGIPREEYRNERIEQIPLKGHKPQRTLLRAFEERALWGESEKRSRRKKVSPALQKG